MKFGNKEVVDFYINSHKNDTSDKVFPNLMLVRSFPFLSNKINKTNIKVLDYGCGYGSNSLFMASKGCEVFFADTSTYALDKTKQKISKEKNNLFHKEILIDANKEALPFLDETFELITCLSLLTLLSDLNTIKLLLNEFYRILKPGGFLYIDINGQKSEFAYYSKILGNNKFVYSGRSKKLAPINVYCPKSEQEFCEIISKNFKIHTSGFSMHKLFEFMEEEFIVIAEKEDN